MTKEQMARAKKEEQIVNDEQAAAEKASLEDQVVEDKDSETTENVAETAEPPEDENTRYLRLAADFQNYKRRMEKERFERYSEGKKDFAADLLPVIDNFDRALKQHEDSAADEHVRAIIEGMAMILKQLEDTLAKNGVNEIVALGEDFDPNFHHAVEMESSGKFESQKVSGVLQKGFKMGEKIIRPSMVKVAE